MTRVKPVKERQKKDVYMKNVYRKRARIGMNPLLRL